MREYYPGNEFYGIGQILRRYAGLSKHYPLNCKIDHGVKFMTGYTKREDCPESYYTFYTSPESECFFLTFNDMVETYLRQVGVKNAKAIGAPVIYMDDYIEKVKRRHPDPKGTVAFPCKSTFGNDYSFDHEEYADMLLELPAKYQPVKVCIYHKDKSKGRDKPYLDRGLKVVCNGGLHNQNFLYELFENIADCKYAVANDNLGSSIYYSMYFGLRYFYYGPEIQQYSCRTEQDRLFAEEKVNGRDFCPYDFPMESCEDTAAQKAIAEEVLGKHRKLTPEQMRRELKRGHTPSFLIRYAASIFFKKFRRLY